jgi:hypothetical protein
MIPSSPKIDSSLDGEIDPPPDPDTHKNDTAHSGQTTPWHEP